MNLYEKAALEAVPTANVGGWWGKGMDDAIAALRAAAAVVAWYKPWTWMKYALLTAATFLEFVRDEKRRERAEEDQD